MAETTKPKYAIGEIIAGSFYAGKIEAAFYSNDEWNYNIGENASIEPVAYMRGEIAAEGYRIGQKFIKETDIKWIQRLGDWKEAE